MTPVEYWIVISGIILMVVTAYQYTANTHDEELANVLTVLRSRDATIARLERERDTTMPDDLLYDRLDSLADRLEVQVQSLRTALASSRERERSSNERETDLREVIRNRNVTIATLQTENADLRAAVTFWQTKVDTLQSTIDNDNGVSNAWSDNLFK